jgi:hypothetical protein
MAKKLETEEVKTYPKVFVTVDGEHELIARDDVQAAAFENAGLKEKE